jgi:hypothetical protein
LKLEYLRISWVIKGSSENYEGRTLDLNLELLNQTLNLILVNGSSNNGNKMT